MRNAKEYLNTSAKLLMQYVTKLQKYASVGILSSWMETHVVTVGILSLYSIFSYTPPKEV